MGKVEQAGPIVAGYDGSPGADQALRWAVSEAALRNVEFQVVHAIEWPDYVGLAEAGSLSDQEHRDLAARLTSTARAASGYTGEVSILDGSVAATLCRLSKTASLLVTGSRGMSDFAGLIVGSTAASVAVHAKCTVVVVRNGESAVVNALPNVTRCAKCLNRPATRTRTSTSRSGWSQTGPAVHWYRHRPKHNSSSSEHAVPAGSKECSSAQLATACCTTPTAQSRS